MNTTKDIVATIVDHGIIRDQNDFLKLDIVDWTRYHAHWKNPQACMKRVSAVFINQYAYKIIDLNLLAYPQRNDFPGWRHVGNHEEMGQLYWNHFHHDFPGSELYFHDSPDFGGVIRYTDQRKDHYPINEFPFSGDIGRVSPIAIIDSMQGRANHCLWISVSSIKRQVILKPFFPATLITTRINELLEPYDMEWHLVEGDVAVKINEENHFLAKENEMAKMTPQQVGRLLKGFGFTAKIQKPRGKVKQELPKNVFQLGLF